METRILRHRSPQDRALEGLIRTSGIPDSRHLKPDTMASITRNDVPEEIPYDYLNGPILGKKRVSRLGGWDHSNITDGDTTLSLFLTIFNAIVKTQPSDTAVIFGEDRYGTASVTIYQDQEHLRVYTFRPGHKFSYDDGTYYYTRSKSVVIRTIRSFLVCIHPLDARTFESLLPLES